jgi:hypothetical protein
MKYRIDIYGYLIQYLPIRKRLLKIIALCKIIIKPIVMLRDDFLIYKQTIDEKLSHNFQVIYLERILNLKFNGGKPGIYITSGNELDEFYLYNNDDNADDVYLFNASEYSIPAYLYNNSEYEALVNFIINVPSTITNKDDQIKAWVRFYNMAGITFVINYI